MTVLMILKIFLVICQLGIGSVDSFGLHTRNVHARSRRKAVEKDSSLWPGGKIPYVISENIARNYIVTDVIGEAMKIIEKDTCVQFIRLNQSDHTDPRLKEKHVTFVKDVGCHSSVGKTDDFYQPVSIGRSCGHLEMILHELGHLVGMWHEHARPDRDNHILVNWSNVEVSMVHNFHIQNEIRLLAPYDLSSVMHYGLKIFSKNKKFNTIEPLIEDLSFLVGYRTDLSFYDKYTVNTLYKCAGYCPETSPRCENDGFLNQYCRCECPRLFIGVRCEEVVTDKKCGGVIDITHKTEVISPFYPDNYEDSMSCVWYFKSPPNTVMNLEFEDFDLEVGRGGVCRDMLEIRHHYIGLERGHVYCGTELNRTFTSTTNKLLLNFNSNYLTTKKGFKAKIILAGKTDCGSSPCLNGGHCNQLQMYDDYYCECQKNWIGRHCEIQVVDGGACEWSPWSSCIAKCGLRTRIRHCDDPTPANGGRECTDVMSQTEKCSPEYFNCNETFMCDFNDENICGMEINGTSRLQWAVHKGPTPSMHTGPETGHSSGTKEDPFVYIESSFGSTKEEAVLWLPEMDENHGFYCLQFYYHMFGMTAGSLRLIRTRNRSNQPQIHWQRSNDNGNKWQEANINLFMYKGIKVGFIGIKGNGYYSDIALDDISLSPGRCSFKDKSYAKGCFKDSKEHKVGPLSYIHDCKRQNCFCNPDGIIDCPEWDTEDICDDFEINFNWNSPKLKSASKLTLKSPSSYRAKAPSKLKASSKLKLRKPPTSKLRTNLNAKTLTKDKVKSPAKLKIRPLFKVKRKRPWKLRNKLRRKKKLLKKLAGLKKSEKQQKIRKKW